MAITDTLTGRKIESKGIAQLTSLSTVQTLSVLDPEARVANSCALQAEGQHIRYTDDGTTDPVAGGPGLLLYAGSPPVQYIGDLAALKFIEEASGAKLNVAIYKVS